MKLIKEEKFMFIGFPKEKIYDDNLSKIFNISIPAPLEYYISGDR